MLEDEFEKFIDYAICVARNGNTTREAAITKADCHEIQCEIK
jgi:hypothetical protein